MCCCAGARISGRQTPDSLLVRKQRSRNIMVEQKQKQKTCGDLSSLFVRLSLWVIALSRSDTVSSIDPLFITDILFIYLFIYFFSLLIY